MKNMKKIFTLLALVVLLTPIITIDYYTDEKGMEEKKYSIVGIIIQDIKDGTVGTKIEPTKNLLEYKVEKIENNIMYLKPSSAKEENSYLIAIDLEKNKSFYEKEISEYMEKYNITIEENDMISVKVGSKGIEKIKNIY